MKCVFDTTQKNTTTYFGEATSDEMCFGFFAYYPLIDGLGFCGQWKSIDMCYSSYDAEFASCDLPTLTKLIVLLPYVCGANCTSTACAVIMDGILSTGCQNYPDVKAYIATYYPSYGTVFAQCSMGRSTKPPTITQPPIGYSTGQPSVRHSCGHSISVYFGFVITLMAYVQK